MPHRYKQSHIPAIFYMNTFDFVVGAICIFTGLRAVLDAGALPTSIGQLPYVLNFTFRSVLLFAGIFILAGLSVSNMRGWGSAAERAGMWLAGTAFVTYGVASILSGYSANATLSILTVLAVGIGCGIRAKGLGYESKALLQALQETPRGDSE